MANKKPDENILFFTINQIPIELKTCSKLEKIDETGEGILIGNVLYIPKRKHNIKTS